MSSSPECKKCGDYIHHGPVLCESCSKGYVELEKVPTTKLIDELEKRVDPKIAEYAPGAISVYAMQGSDEGVIVRYFQCGSHGMDKRPETLRYGIYRARIIVAVDEEPVPAEIP